MNAINLLHPGIKQRADWRSGFMVAIEQRINLNAPPSMSEPEVARKCSESPNFAKGYRAGMDCALACSHPEPDYQHADQYDKAGFIMGALCIVALLALYIVNA